MIKKFISKLALVLCIVPIITIFVACSDAGAPDHNTSEPNFAVTAQDIMTELEMFLDGRENRTSYSSAEAAAAEYLNERLLDFGYDAEIIGFTATENDVENLSSQNVVARYRANSSSGSDVKNVVIGAFYDNRYASAYKGAEVYGAEAALANGSGVATLLEIAEYLKSNSVALDFDVTFVFFGASFATDMGASKYYSEQMTAAERRNTVLMVELQRLGVDHVYAFSDARETSREGFFDDIAADNGLDIYKVTQKTPLITGVSTFDGVPFFQWAHSGIFGSFFDAGIPTLNLVGANWETISFNDNESYKNDNIAYTKLDTLSNLLRYYPDCGEKMATAATLVIRSLESEKFLSVMTYDKNNFPDTSILTKQWVWYLIVLCVIIVAVAIMMVVNAHLVKKYPVVAPKPIRMKMAVFGMDYEDKSASDVFIDIKPSADEEIFPGISNNEPHKSAMDDIFPSLFDDDKNSIDGDDDKTDGGESRSDSENSDGDKSSDE